MTAAFDPGLGGGESVVARQNALIRELRRAAHELLEAEQLNRSAPTLDNIGRLSRARQTLAAVAALDEGERDVSPDDFEIPDVGLGDPHVA